MKIFDNSESVNSKEIITQVIDSENNEQLKVQRSFVNLRGTAQYNSVKTRKPMQQRTT